MWEMSVSWRIKVNLCVESDVFDKVGNTRPYSPDQEISLSSIHLASNITEHFHPGFYL